MASRAATRDLSAIPCCLNLDCLNLDFHKINMIALIFKPLFIKVPLVAGYKNVPSSFPYSIINLWKIRE
jgi:hypothetical protein